MASSLEPKEDWVRSFRSKLVRWYERERRVLPWRGTRDPYAIWLSEIMLQQTQVATVLGYYERFLTTFPTVIDLANADEQEVLKLWAGLGYYRRARQLHAAAKVIRDDYGGHFPEDFESVLALPGVGRYTAGAVCSFAFEQRQPILEANTNRLFSRLTALREDPRASDSQKLLWEFADRILPKSTVSRKAAEKARLAKKDGPSGGPFSTINQAVMELGSQVCTPKSPKCLVCPVRELCPTFEAGLQLEIPKAPVKKKPEQLGHALVFVLSEDHVLMRQNQPGQWWEGLWDFPRLETSARLKEAKVQSGKNVGRWLTQTAKRQIEADFLSELAIELEVAEPCFELSHGVTKYRIRVVCLQAQLLAPIDDSLTQYRWVSLAELESSVPLTSTAKRLAEARPWQE
ncbi:MAG: A/G-specific adenine glycosylase [Pirellulaceae bacterium]